VHPQASLPANPTAQQPISHALDEDHHAFFTGFDFPHSVGFQAQLFSDKRFNEHLGSFPFLGCWETTTKGYRTEVQLLFLLFTPGDSKALNANYTFGIATFYCKLKN
jgi:hypothetical protein